MRNLLMYQKASQRLFLLRIFLVLSHIKPLKMKKTMMNQTKLMKMKITMMNQINLQKIKITMKKFSIMMMKTMKLI